MRHVVTVTAQRRGIGAWITESVDLFGPFYTSATAQEFARRVATGVQRVRWSMGEDTVVDKTGADWTVRDHDDNRRVIITATAIRPSSIRSAWRTIREHFNDRRIR